MQLSFYKYQGTGNDFIMLDNRLGNIILTPEQINWLCNRRFGIGADGLILLELDASADFKMVYYNSDGKPSSMCGNGGRCIVAFAKQLGIVKDKAKFLAIDGMHDAVINEEYIVSLKMNDVKNIEFGPDFFYLNTGSPHYVKQIADVKNFDVKSNGALIRYSNRFKEEGTNINFIERLDKGVFVRTYERGVEDETFSCGTGVVAAAIVAAVSGFCDEKNKCFITTLGGDLEVRFERVLEQHFYNIWLIGPANFVFNGSVDLV